MIKSFLSSFLRVSTRVLALGIHTRAFSPRLRLFHEEAGGRGQSYERERGQGIEREKQTERERERGDWNDGQEGGRKGLECPSEEE